MAAQQPLTRFLNRKGLTTPAWLGIAVLFIAALTVSIRAGGLAGAVALLGASAVIFFSGRQLAGEDARFVLAAAGYAFVLRVFLAGLLDIALTATGHTGALFLDDATYLRIASQLASAWRNGGPPIDIDPTQGGNYIRLAAALFFVFGPDAIVLKLMNTAFGILAGLVVYRTMVNLRTPGPRIGLLLTLFFPSLVLWSALALKDTYVLFFTVVPIWLMSEYKRTGRFLPWYPLLVGSLLAIENVRPYVYVILLVAWPLSTPFFVGRGGWRKPTAFAAAVALLLLATTPALTYLNPSIVTGASYIRQAMALGARSGFVEPLPVVRGNPGDRFVITAAGRTPVPSDSIRIIEVRPGVNLVLEGSSPGSQPDPNEIVVRPGDVIVIEPLPSSKSGSPTGTPAPVALTAAGRNVVGSPTPAQAPGGSSEDALTIPRSMLEALRYLPLGILYVVAAPVPFTSSSLVDLATIPEMLLWYVSELFAVWGLILLVRRRRFEFAYGVLVLGGIGLTLSLFEGNAGTLLRHRGMIIPFIVVLAAVGVSDALEGFRQIRYPSSDQRTTP